MNTFVIVRSEEDLQHHGIKGMKWGVRRYQNYDGSYTKKGLERYKKSEAAYDKANANYKAAKVSGNKADIRKSRSERRQAKREMSNKYDQLKRDKLADQGKQLYKEGKRIRYNDFATKFAGTMISAVGGYVTTQAYESGKTISTKHGNIPLSSITAAATLGAEMVNGGYYLKTRNQNRKLRAYYGH